MQSKRRHIVHRCQMPKTGKSLQVKKKINRLVVSREEDKRAAANAHRFLFWEDENVLELDNRSEYRYS